MSIKNVIQFLMNYSEANGDECLGMVAGTLSSPIQHIQFGSCIGIRRKVGQQNTFMHVAYDSSYCYVFGTLPCAHEANDRLLFVSVSKTVYSMQS